ncbi:LysM peptidoglycan-binding domain-containing protein [Weissella confusa]|uniref:LysM peptidoglycan-binding domain-containing protein n=1 Tax=Weissella confusa TaxID=1583 RepID=UPI000E4A3291|nr:LysM domain-containing protein [Weissella confusa]MBA5934315.1 LysM peptidoglycan-binding domain-containing protein [Weissella confusa]MBF7056888.1 LysM peptidoglycan-binding domain-containing protein [Weissella confusa]MBJ7620935.1 LysM peptidoglycan-binding domain-containing protein [Weissella confusa]MBJ7637280.1 LysM peptidoglycan-binding domain-containing protein [Weissella confusa]MBJ7643796.1 LysM peptidoglycan-binding domain-containing protein [Weissella confusa]
MFVVGFTLPVLMNSITGGAQRETTKTAKVASSSSSDQEKSASEDGSTTESEAQTGNEAESGTSSAEVTASETEAESSSSAATGTTITVPQGATAYSIAKQHGLTLAQLQALNPSVNMNALQAGEAIVVSE